MSYTDRTINGVSFHPVAHKQAAYLGKIHRFLNIPLDHHSYMNELSTMKHIADLNKIILM